MKLRFGRAGLVSLRIAFYFFSITKGIGMSKRNKEEYRSALGVIRVMRRGC